MNNSLKLFKFNNLRRNITKYRNIYDEYKKNILKNEDKNGLYVERTMSIDEYAISCSFISYVENDETFAKKSSRIIENVFFKTPYFDNKKGLNLYFKNMCLSFCYDLCKHTRPWRRINQRVSKEILKLSDYCYLHGGSGQNQSSSSNWKALRYSSAGIGYIATDEEDHLKETKIFGCFLKCRKYIQTNFNGGFGGIEGDGYTRYAWSGLGPFGIALEKNYDWLIDDSDNFDVEYQFMWDLISMVPIEYRKKNGESYRGFSPDFATDKPTCSDSKFMGLAWYYLDPEHLSGLMQIFNTVYDGKKYYAPHNSGIIHLLSFINPDIPPESPLHNDDWVSSLDEKFSGNGYHSFRNKVEDKTDIVCQLHACHTKHSGHMGPDKSGFRIVGNDTIWAIGGGWYSRRDENSNPCYIKHANTIFPGGYGGPQAKKVHIPFGRTKGKTLRDEMFIGENGTVNGYCITTSNAQNNFDTENMIRRFITDFEVDGVESCIIVADTSLNGRYWQMSTCYNNNIKIIDDNKILLQNETNTHSLMMHIIYPKNEYEINIYETVRGGNYLYKDSFLSKNKNIVIERLDPVPGMTKEMTLEKNRGLRNSLLYNRDENNNLVSPNRQDHEGDFIVVLTICNNEQSHPTVYSDGENIYSTGVDLIVNNRKYSINYDEVKMR